MKHQCDRDGRITYCYRQDSEPEFDPRVFDHEYLAASDQVRGLAEGGRGNTFLIVQGGASLVLRHYQRGGMARYLSDASYVYTGLESTRAWREFICLCVIENQSLPAARPYACRIERHGLVYSASLVTYQLNGATLATRLIDGKVGAEEWRNIGDCIARFHRAGICHADLNAHNILVENTGLVSLIDFDRARHFKPLSEVEPPAWSVRNIERLWRSVCKSTASQDRHLGGFTELRKSWAAHWL